MLYKVECCFDKVERCLDIVAFGNNVEAAFDFIADFGNKVERVFGEISSFRQIRNKLNMFNLFRICRKDEISRKTRSENKAERCFDIVAGVDVI